MAEHPRRPGGFDLTSGRLCLDFANTVRARPLSVRTEYIANYGDLLDWSRQATILTVGETESLAAEADRSPKEAEAALAVVLELREALYGIFSARAAGLPAPGADLQTLNWAIARSMGRAGLVQSALNGRFEWTWPDTQPGLDRVSWWVARSAAELLTSDDLTFVRECAGYDCGWLFLDTTRNRSRRWCDMSTCGNRAKGRRHYERKRSTRSGEGG
ncbi:MAG TPA: ABATE domain-containing protein [Streptosporangiaceae bacterium]|nr:ABATE domain-containing protein [Candidatus Methylomirabilis sp.]HYB48766.1 ABATE domain-containing protein [Streptosporangiaceae bacterium]